MKVAIVGTRSFMNRDLMFGKLDSIGKIDRIYTGDAKGADTLAVEYAKANNIPYEVFYADWEKYGRAAGPIRNKDIVANADLVIAFWDGKSPGTKSSIDIAKRTGKDVIVVLV
jgi:hypothetical protein